MHSYQNQKLFTAFEKKQYLHSSRWSLQTRNYVKHGRGSSQNYDPETSVSASKQSHQIDAWLQCRAGCESFDRLFSPYKNWLPQIDSLRAMDPFQDIFIRNNSWSRMEVLVCLQERLMVKKRKRQRLQGRYPTKLIFWSVSSWVLLELALYSDRAGQGLSSYFLVWHGAGMQIGSETWAQL